MADLTLDPSLERSLKELSSNVKTLSDHLSTLNQKVTDLLSPTVGLGNTVKQLTEVLGMGTEKFTSTGQAIKQVTEELEKLKEVSSRLAKTDIKDTSEKLRDLFETDVPKHLGKFFELFRKEYHEKLGGYAAKFAVASGHLGKFGKELSSFLYDIQKKSFTELVRGLEDLAKRSTDLIGIYGSTRKELTSTQGKLQDLLNYLERDLTSLSSSAKTLVEAMIASFKQTIPEGTFLAKRIEELSKKFEEVKEKAPIEKLKEFYEELEEIRETIGKAGEALSRYNKDVASLILAHISIGDQFEKFKNIASMLPSPLSNIVIKLAAFAKKIADTTLSLMNLTGSFKIVAEFSRYIRDLISIIGIGRATVAGVTMSILILLEIIRQLILGSVQLTKAAMEAFGQLTFGVTSLRDFTLSLTRTWSILYSTTDIIKKTGEVFSVLRPVTSGFIDNFYRGVHGVSEATVEFSLVVDRVARGLGISAKELSSDLLSFATYFRFSIDSFLKDGREGARKLLRIWAGFNHELIQLANITGREFMSTFRPVFEQLMWLGETTTSNFYKRVREMVAAVSSEVQKMGGTIDHTKTLLSTLSQAVQSATWDMYLGVLAATGRWTGTLDDMIAKAFTTEPVERMFEITRYFREIAKYSAGLEKTWAYFIPPLRAAVERVPAMATKLGEVIESWMARMQVPGVTARESFIQALEQAGMTADQIEDVMLAVDALGDPLKMLVNLVQRLIDIVTSWFGLWRAAGRIVRMVR
jgi:uncharacterized protein YoxC